MYEPDESKAVPVAAIFGDTYKDVRPFRIRWENKDYTITQVGYRHQYRKDQSVIHVFSATDGVNLFELLLDATDIRWILDRLRMKQYARS